MAAQKAFYGICALILATLACRGSTGTPNIQEAIETRVQETLDANSAVGTTLPPSSTINTDTPSDIGTPVTSLCGELWNIVITSVSEVEVGDGTKVVLITLGIENNSAFSGQLKGPDDDWLSNGAEPTTYLTATDGSTYPYLYGVLPISAQTLSNQNPPLYGVDTGWIATEILPPGFVSLGVTYLDKPQYYKLAFPIPRNQVPKSIFIGGMRVSCIGSTSSGDVPAKTYNISTDISNTRAQPSAEEYPDLVGSKIDLPYEEGTLDFKEVTRDGNTVSVILDFTNLSSDTTSPRFNGFIIGDSRLSTCQEMTRFACRSLEFYGDPVGPGQTQTITWLFNVPNDESNLFFVYAYDIADNVPNKVYKID